MFTIGYLLLIVGLVLFSWVGNIYGLGLPDGTVIPNLLSEEAVRWFVRHSIDNISAAPVVEVLLIMIMVGALRSSRLLAAFGRRGTLVGHRHHHALYMALGILIVCVGVVLAGIVPGGGLLSVTGHIEGGPFASGWLFLLMGVVCIPCIVYGCMSGQWSTKEELFAGLVSGITACANYFLTLMVASLLVATIRYIHLFELIGLSGYMSSLLILLVYVVPLIVIFVTNYSIHEPSSIE